MQEPLLKMLEGNNQCGPSPVDILKVSLTVIYINFMTCNIYFLPTGKLNFTDSRLHKKKYFFTLRAQSVTRVKQRALNQALHTSYEKIVFDTRVRK